ncbi:isochorismatase family cysteine hydrolase [Mesorhizobium sp. M0663]|uniref:cysteine hydrolase family protein n=1 Tax=unclassified Mesorhizobium TaxID=325217 RepID=UPI00333550ED
MADFPVNPLKLALVNIDLQNVFVEGTPAAAPDGPEVVARVNKLAAVCRQAGVLVIHTAHVIRPDGSNAGVMGELIPPTHEGMLAEGSFPAAFHKDLKIEPSDIVLKKPRYGAFHGTDLEVTLRSRGIDSVIITGIATNVCAETTAREAAVRDFRVFFLSDGTSTAGIDGVPRDVLVRTTCAVLGLAFAQVLTVDQMIDKIKLASSAVSERVTAPHPTAT